MKVNILVFTVFVNLAFCGFAKNATAAGPTLAECSNLGVAYSILNSAQLTAQRETFNVCGDGTCQVQYELGFINNAVSETQNLYNALGCSNPKSEAYTGPLNSGVYSPLYEGSGSCLNWAGVNYQLNEVGKYLGGAYDSAQGSGNDVNALTQIDDNAAAALEVVQVNMQLFRITFPGKSCY